MNKNGRREFLKTLALTTAATVTSPLLASQRPNSSDEDYKALVCVLLEGGADSLNFVAPKTEFSEYLRYLKVRPHTAHNREKIRTLRGVKYGLHPKMARLQRLYNYGNLAIIANVGVLEKSLKLDEIKKAKYPADIKERPSQLFDHVAQRDMWMQAGVADSGWAARVADLMAKDYVNVSVAGENSLQYGSKQKNLIAHDDIFGADETVKKVKKAKIDTYFEDDDSMEGKSLGKQLELVIDLIEHRKRSETPNRQIFFVSYGGWDIHNAADGTAANELMENKVAYMDKSLGEFYNALQKLGLDKKVTTFTMSDFGRSVENIGDDHGWGGHAFVMGGAIKSGIYGKMPKIAKNTPDALKNGALIPTVSCEQYLSPLVKWLGDDKIDLKKVFPNLHKFEDKKLDFIA